MCSSILGVNTEEPLANCSVIYLQNAIPTLYYLPPATCHRSNNLRCDWNTTVYYRCDDEYNLLGPSVTTCVAQDTWFPPPGRCVHKSKLFVHQVH